MGLGHERRFPRSIGSIARPFLAFPSAADGLRVQLSEVVGGAVECPFAFGLLVAPHHEAVGALVFLHLAEHRFHGLAAQAVESPAPLGQPPAKSISEGRLIRK